jgi:hypothetical protein
MDWCRFKRRALASGVCSETVLKDLGERLVGFFGVVGQGGTAREHLAPRGVRILEREVLQRLEIPGA